MTARLGTKLNSVTSKVRNREKAVRRLIMKLRAKKKWKQNLTKRERNKMKWMRNNKKSWQTIDTQLSLPFALLHSLRTTMTRLERIKNILCMCLLGGREQKKNELWREYCCVVGSPLRKWTQHWEFGVYIFITNKWKNTEKEMSNQRNRSTTKMFSPFLSPFHFKVLWFPLPN